VNRQARGALFHGYAGRLYIYTLIKEIAKIPVPRILDREPYSVEIGLFSPWTNNSSQL
jgi:hypothetical protein